MADSDATSKPTTTAEVHQVAETKVDASNNPEPTTATLATPEAGLDQAESKVDSSNNLESTKATPEAEIVQAETKVDTSNNPEPANPTPETGLNQAETEPQQALAQHNEADTKPKEALAKSNPTEQQRSKAAYDSSARHGNNKTHKSSAKMNRRDVNKHRKFDPSVRRITDDPDEIRKQVEFYFGDWNFPQDKFMWESCGGPDNKPIPISTIHSFKRMRCFQPYSAVVLALRQSTFLDVDGEEGQESVKRKVAYKSTADAKAKAEASSVYVKGFGEEDPNTQFDLESFFAKFGEVRGLKLRRTNDGLFKGSVFVTFQDEEAAKQFIELQPAPTYKGNELKIMSKRAYCEDKSELIRQGKLQPNPVAPKKFFEGHDASWGS
ncbi:hypothetical protein CDD82_5634 [Ophiocordyceps australis]|uniref:HTH La-type RNA-binding domain-containing protein n=1 Tax=Ophiocordyceps australis TaxID=1399860 RepID=A0A2C5Z1B1_9HYPO|nr:hypothetical protein CDD82_5634 [Ophiocordyceps australis]